MNHNREFRIGTRGSRLALIQAEQVASVLKRNYPALAPALVKIKTSGDKLTRIPLSQVGGKGLFIKEIEEALLEGRVDAAVHSMKDVPTEIAPGLEIAAVLEREDPSDALISRRGKKLAALPRRARIGTSSLRRQAQLLSHRPDLRVVPLRGNLDTRLRKLATTRLDAIVVATAGMYRLGRQDEITEVLPIEISLPAIGQGALGVEVRAEDPKTRDLVTSLNHRSTVLTITAERAFLRRLGGSCQIPIAAYGQLEGDRLHLTGLVILPDGSRMVQGEQSGSVEDADAIGVALAEDLLGRGAEQILQELSGKPVIPPAAP